MSPHKRRDPLGWPFGALPPRVLAKLLREREQRERDKAPSAPF
jgi:hypothetical protein